MKNIRLTSVDHMGVYKISILYFKQQVFLANFHRNGANLYIFLSYPSKLNRIFLRSKGAGRVLWRNCHDRSYWWRSRSADKCEQQVEIISSLKITTKILVKQDYSVANMVLKCFVDRRRRVLYCISLLVIFYFFWTYSNIRFSAYKFHIKTHIFNSFHCFILANLFELSTFQRSEQGRPHRCVDWSIFWVIPLQVVPWCNVMGDSQTGWLWLFVLFISLVSF